MDLNKRREEILTEHRAQEKYDPHWQAEARNGQPISERPVAFVCDDEVVVLGPCVTKVFAGLRSFVDLVAPVFNDPERARTQPNYKHHAFTRVKRLLEKYPKPPAELRLHQQTWNAVTCALGEAGVLVVTTDGTYKE